MKNSKFILGVLVGFFAFLSISAISSDGYYDEVPRYHVIQIEENGEKLIVTYDATTGKFNTSENLPIGKYLNIP